jgi:hypothetical protein
MAPFLFLKEAELLKTVSNILPVDYFGANLSGRGGRVFALAQTTKII